MTRKRKVIFTCCTLAMILICWFAFALFSTWRSIPEAYAAWDTAELVITYLDTNDGQWPKSWNDLLTAVPHHTTTFRGSQAGDTQYPQSLQQIVAMDWSADPIKLAAVPEGNDDKPPFHVITRRDGSVFPVVFQGAEPNIMIWSHLQITTNQ